jgi:membrane protein DedA with SNARE-associated domain
MSMPALLHTAFLISGHEIDHLLHGWGYAVTFVFVLLQSAGIPVLGTTALAATSIYAATTHRLEIAGVIAAGATAAILGFAISYGLGRWGGWRLLERYGRRIRLSPARLAQGRAFFDAHGGKVVFAGRFITGLRTWSGLIAGANLMPWRTFLAMNIAGGLVWATANGLGYYYFGDAISSASTGLQIVLVLVGIGAAVLTLVALRNRARRLTATAEAEPRIAPE